MCRGGSLTLSHAVCSQVWQVTLSEPDSWASLHSSVLSLLYVSYFFKLLHILNTILVLRSDATLASEVVPCWLSFLPPSGWWKVRKETKANKMLFQNKANKILSCLRLYYISDRGKHTAAISFARKSPFIPASFLGCFTFSLFSYSIIKQGKKKMWFLLLNCMQALASKMKLINFKK